MRAILRVAARRIKPREAHLSCGRRASVESVRAPLASILLLVVDLPSIGAWRTSAGMRLQVEATVEGWS